MKSSSKATVLAILAAALYALMSPFIGALLGMILFREMPGALFWVAFALMVCGVWLSVKDALE